MGRTCHLPSEGTSATPPSPTPPRQAKRNPAHYGLPATAPEAVLERLALQTFVVGSVQALAAHGLATTDGDGFALAPTRAGRLAAAHYLRLPTMAALLAAPPRASTGDLLDLVCRAAELGEVTLRRGDKKVLNELNKAAAAAPAAARGGSHWVPAPGRPAKAKDRLETGQEKLFVLVGGLVEGWVNRGWARGRGRNWHRSHRPPPPPPPTPPPSPPFRSTPAYLMSAQTASNFPCAPRPTRRCGWGGGWRPALLR